MRNINQTIQIISNIMRHLIVFAIGIMLAKMVWWFTNPLGYHTFDDMVGNYYKSDTLAQGIVNRAPFGIITEEKVEKPSFLDQVKVVGVYAGGPHNSIAFLSIGGKSSIAQLGDSLEGSKITAINPNGIVVLNGTKSVEIPISGSTTDNNNTVNRSNQTPTYNPNQQNNQQGINNSYIPNENISNNNGQQNNAQGQQQDNNNGNKNDQDSMAEKRRKMIEEFQRQNSVANNPQTNQSN